MKTTIRQEKQSDFQDVFSVIEKAFKDDPLSDDSEQFLVERLRKSTAFIPELSLIAELNNKIIGHILLTRIQIKNDKIINDSLALAPVSVNLRWQNQGVGSKLIIRAHEIAKGLGYQSIVLLGHENYYPKFGYERASKFGITLPFEVPDENCMAIELEKGGLEGVSGMVEYAPEFFE